MNLVIFIYFHIIYINIYFIFSVLGKTIQKQRCRQALARSAQAQGKPNCHASTLFRGLQTFSFIKVGAGYFSVRTFLSMSLLPVSLHASTLTLLFQCGLFPIDPLGQWPLQRYYLHCAKILLNLIPILSAKQVLSVLLFMLLQKHVFKGEVRKFSSMIRVDERNSNNQVSGLWQLPNFVK